jgi:hypothetical protein
LRARLGFALLGAGVFPLLSVSAVSSGNFVSAFVLAASGAIALITGELLERTLFFAACAAPRMPGAPA